MVNISFSKTRFIKLRSVTIQLFGYALLMLIPSTTLLTSKESKERLKTLSGYTVKP
jgi:hypothetical protein